MTSVNSFTMRTIEYLVWNMLKAGTQFYIKFCGVYLLMVILIPGSVVKNLPKAGDADSIPGSGRSPGEGNGNPLQYSCLGNPMDRGAWWTTAHGVAKSRT